MDRCSRCRHVAKPWREWHPCILKNKNRHHSILCRSLALWRHSTDRDFLSKISSRSSFALSPHRNIKHFYWFQMFLADQKRHLLFSPSNQVSAAKVPTSYPFFSYRKFSTIFYNITSLSEQWTHNSWIFCPSESTQPLVDRFRFWWSSANGPTGFCGQYWFTLCLNWICLCTFAHYFCQWCRLYRQTVVFCGCRIPPLSSGTQWRHVDSVWSLLSTSMQWRTKRRMSYCRSLASLTCAIWATHANS